MILYIAKLGAAADGVGVSEMFREMEFTEVLGDLGGHFG